MVEVELDRVKKTYPGGVCAVSDLNLTVREGEYLVMVGPSGCGKTTSLRLIAGLETVSAGTIRIGGRDIDRVAPKDRDIAMVFQSPALYPHLSVFANMAFGLKLRKEAATEIERKVRWAAEMLGMSRLLDRRPRELSGGQRQRVALGRAVVRRARVLLLDEPLAGLDAPLRLQTRAELKHMVGESGCTTIHVTHDQEEAMALGDRVAVMEKGVVHQCDTPLRLYRRPINQFVAGALGTPPINFLEGTVRQEAGHTYVVSSAIRLQLTNEEAAWAARRVGRPIVLGIRPQGLRWAMVAENVDQTGQQILGKVDYVETLGAQMDVHIRLVDGGRLVSRTDTHTVRPGDTVALCLQRELVHWFEPNQQDPSHPAVTKYGRNIALDQRNIDV